MSLWGTQNQANNVPKWSAQLVDAGSGHANQAANNVSLFDNMTPNQFINGETVSIIGASFLDINNGTYPVPTPGWYIKRTGTGGRAGRVQYEALVAIPSFGTQGLWNLDFSNPENSQILILGMV